MKIKKREVNKAIKNINKKLNTNIVIKDIDGVSAILKGDILINIDCGIMATELDAEKVYEGVMHSLKKELSRIDKLLTEM
jgi:hypothetical protein